MMKMLQIPHLTAPGAVATLTLITLAIIIPDTSATNVTTMYASQDDYLRLYDKLTGNYTKDVGLVWEPNEYGNISKLSSLTQEIIWTPKITMPISIHDTESFWTEGTSQSVFSNGTVKFYRVGRINSFCALDMTYFPFDYQLCKLSIQSTAPNTEVDFSHFHASLGDDFSANSEWEVLDIYGQVIALAPTDRTVSLTMVFISLKRQSNFNNLNILTPVIIFSLLCMLTFFVPVESGERLSYTLTTLLSLSVYMTYIGGIIPRSSKPLPLLFQYIVSLFVISAASVVLTLLAIKLRWSRVRKDFTGRAYIQVMRCQIYLDTKQWQGKVGALCRLMGSVRDSMKTVPYPAEQNEGETGNGHSGKEDLIVDNGYQCKDYAMFRSMGDKTEKRFYKGNPEADGKLGQLEETRDQKNTESSSQSDETDSGLLALCDFLDLFNFALIFLAFNAMGIYTVIQFSLQQKPIIN